MKILLIHSYLFETGGDWTYIKTIKNIFEKNGDEVSLFGIGSPINQITYNVNDEILKEYIYFNSSVNISYLKKILLSLKIIFNLNVFIKLYDHIKKINPDYIQLNSIHSALSPAVLFAIWATRTKAKLVWRVLDYKLICPNRTLISNKKFNCTKCVGKLFPLPVISNKCKNNSLIQSLLAFLENSIINLLLKYIRIDKFLVQSQFSKEMLLRAKININKIEIIYNPIDVYKNSNTENLKTKSKEYDLIFFGRLSKEKGIDFLLNTISKSNYRLLIVGAGPLKELVESFSNKFDNIVFIGELWGDVLMEHIKSSHITVIPSIWNEVSPYVLLESYRCGIPALVSNCGGTKDLIIENISGEIFFSLDEISFMQKIKYMLDNYHLYNEHLIFKHLINNNSFEAYYKKIINLYEN